MRNPTFFDRALGVCLATALASMPTHVMAAAPKGEDKAAQAEAPAAAPTEVTGAVALLRFTGPDPATTVRDNTQDELRGKGLTIKSVALDAAGAAKKVKCRGGEMDDSCLAAMGKWLNKSKKTAADYIVYGGVVEDGGIKKATVVVYDIAKTEKVGTYNATFAESDFIVPLMLPRALASDLGEHIVPALAATDAEKAILAELDEPTKTAEEIAEEQKQIADAETAAGQVDLSDVDTSGIVYDIKEDFKEYCRDGKRKKRESKDDDLDPRPKCSAGTFWGYWQPRAVAFLTVTLISAGAMGGLYGMALSRKGPYDDAVAAVKAFEADANPTTDPYDACNADGVCYADLASEVSKTGAEMKSVAVVGDAMLGVTLLFAGVLGIIIAQDRNYSKSRLTDEKRARAISGFSLSPMVGRGTGGGAMGFNF
jgi:hypothetical protein